MNAFRQWVAKSRLMQNCVRPFDRHADIGLKAMARLSMRPLFPSRFRVQDFGKRFIRYDYRTGGILVNTGDYVQSIATERAIRKVMGDDVVFTPEVRGLLSCYDGEPAICVMRDGMRWARSPFCRMSESFPYGWERISRTASAPL